MDQKFIRQGSEYVTGNYDSAANRIELTVGANVGRVEVNID